MVVMFNWQKSTLLKNAEETKRISEVEGLFSPCSCCPDQFAILQSLYRGNWDPRWAGVHLVGQKTVLDIRHVSFYRFLSAWDNLVSKQKKTEEHWPAELLHSADVDDPVVEVVHKLWHVLFQEPLVCMHRVTCRRRKKRNLRGESAQEHCHLTSALTHQRGDTVQVECAVW